MHACMCALHVFLGKTACSYNLFFLKPTEVISSASGDEPDEIGKTLLTPCSEAVMHQEKKDDKEFLQQYIDRDSPAQLKKV